MSDINLRIPHPEIECCAVPRVPMLKAGKRAWALTHTRTNEPTTVVPREGAEDVWN